MERTMKFRELKPYMSKIDRLSIRVLDENLSYKNYRWLQAVPDRYDEMYVVGFGRIESEFEEEAVLTYEKERCAIGRGLYMVDCIEIVLSEIPVKDTPNKCDLSEYCHIWSRFPKSGGIYRREKKENAKKQIHRRFGYQKRKLWI